MSAPEPGAGRTPAIAPAPTQPPGRNPPPDPPQTSAPSTTLAPAPARERTDAPGGAARAELRRQQRKLRRKAIEAALPQLLQVLQRELPPRLPPGRHLGLFWPIGSEPDLRPLASSLGLPLALPAVHPWKGSAGAPGVNDGLRLVYRPWQPDAPLAPDACGIPAPMPGQPLDASALGLLLVPALAIDRRGLRLGSGGGWYDRLRSDPAWRAVPALAVLPSACLLPTLAAEAWDIPFDGWIDERGLHSISEQRAESPRHRG